MAQCSPVSISWARMTKPKAPEGVGREGLMRGERGERVCVYVRSTCAYLFLADMAWHAPLSLCRPMGTASPAGSWVARARESSAKRRALVERMCCPSALSLPLSLTRTRIQVLDLAVLGMADQGVSWRGHGGSESQQHRGPGGERERAESAPARCVRVLSLALSSHACGALTHLGVCGLALSGVRAAQSLARVAMAGGTAVRARVIHE